MLSDKIGCLGGDKMKWRKKELNGKLRSIKRG